MNEPVHHSHLAYYMQTQLPENKHYMWFVAPLEYLAQGYSMGKFGQPIFRGEFQYGGKSIYSKGDICGLPYRYFSHENANVNAVQPQPPLDPQHQAIADIMLGLFKDADNNFPAIYARKTPPIANLELPNILSYHYITNRSMPTYFTPWATAIDSGATLEEAHRYAIENDAFTQKQYIAMLGIKD